jgi:hypothetical protein
MPRDNTPRNIPRTSNKAPAGNGSRKFRTGLIGGARRARTAPKDVHPTPNTCTTIGISTTSINARGSRNGINNTTETAAGIVMVRMNSRLSGRVARGDTDGQCHASARPEAAIAAIAPTNASVRASRSKPKNPNARPTSLPGRIVPIVTCEND